MFESASCKARKYIPIDTYNKCIGNTFNQRFKSEVYVYNDNHRNRLKEILRPKCIMRCVKMFDAIFNSCVKSYKYVSENSTSEAEAREDFVQIEIPPPIALSDVPSPVG